MVRARARRTPRFAVAERVTHGLLVGVVLLPASACGSQWTATERRQVEARYAAGAASGAGGATAVGPGEVVVPGEQVTAGPTGLKAAGPVTPGAPPKPAGADPKAPAAGAAPGPAGGAPKMAGGQLKCAAASRAPGVTTNSIALGSVSTLSGPVPGLGASAAAAARAHVAYRNSTGGVCGRKIVLREADDGADGARYRSAVRELEPSVLGIGGGFAFGDVGGKDVISSKNLPVVNIPSDQGVADLPSVVDTNPDFASRSQKVGKYGYIFAQGARKVSVVYLDSAQTRFEAELQQSLMKAAGLKVVDVQALPVSTLSYDPAARRVANSGADYMMYIGDVNGDANMARSIAGTDAELKFQEYFVFAYGTPFTELAGEAAEGTVTWMRTLPAEEKGNKEVEAYAEWMDRIAPDAATDSFAADSWVGVKILLDALEDLPGPITRAALLAQIKSVGTYDADGMLGPIKLGAEESKGCFLGLRFTRGKWVRMTPATGFLC